MGVNQLSFPKCGRHFFFKVTIRFLCGRELYTSYSDSKHLNMTNLHLRSAIVIMNMENIITPIS